jgi:hypothetical protein
MAQAPAGTPRPLLLVTQNWQVVPVGMPLTCTSNWVPEARAAYRTVMPARVAGLTPRR